MNTKNSKIQTIYEVVQSLTKNVTWRFPSTISDSEPIFIVGSPRSGTTLLQRIISNHSRLFSIQAETGLFTYQNIFNAKRRHFGLPQQEIEELLKNSVDVVDFFDQGMNSLSDNHGEKRFVEKTPQHVLHLPFILRHFPKAKVINIIRDGRDCYCSAKNYECIPQRSSAERFAKYWRKCVSASTAYAQDNRILNVAYEQLTENPSVVLEEIMNFIDLSAEESQLSSTRISNDKRSDLKEFKRLREPINSSSVGRWRIELTNEEIQDFSKIAGEVLVHCGYSL